MHTCGISEQAFESADGLYTEDFVTRPAATQASSSLMGHQTWKKTSALPLIITNKIYCEFYLGDDILCLTVFACSYVTVNIIEL